MKWLLALLVTFLILSIFALAGLNVWQFYTSQGESISVNKPATLGIPLGTELACESLVSTSLGEEINWDDQNKNTIVGKVTKGNDKLAIEIKEQEHSLSLLTQTAVGIGIAEPAVFTIVENDDEHLLAVYMPEEEPSSQFNTFTLNKKSRLAIWQKSRPTFASTDSPFAYSEYLFCN